MTTTAAITDWTLEPEAQAAALQALRADFPASAIGKLPRVTCRDCSDSRKTCDRHTKQKCDDCNAFTSTAHIHLDYVGHAGITDRLLSVDPLWTWEPVAWTEEGLPRVTFTGSNGTANLWIRLSVAGVTRLGVGTAEAGKGDVLKELIGDALRNAAMRFGVALSLWGKSELESASAPPEPEHPPLVVCPKCEARFPDQAGVRSHLVDSHDFTWDPDGKRVWPPGKGPATAAQEPQDAPEPAPMPESTPEPAPAPPEAATAASEAPAEGWDGGQQIREAKPAPADEVDLEAERQRGEAARAKAAAQAEARGEEPFGSTETSEVTPGTMTRERAVEWLAGLKAQEVRDKAAKVFGKRDERAEGTPKELRARLLDWLMAANAPEQGEPLIPDAPPEQAPPAEAAPIEVPADAAIECPDCPPGSTSFASQEDYHAHWYDAHERPDDSAEDDAPEQGQAPEATDGPAGESPISDATKRAVMLAMSEARGPRAKALAGFRKVHRLPSVIEHWSEQEGQDVLEHLRATAG